MMRLLSGRAALWLLLSVILVLNVPASSAPHARYIPPQAQVATPAAAALKSETVYKEGPYGAGSRWKGQTDTAADNNSAYDAPKKEGSSKENPFLADSTPDYSSQEHNTLVHTPQYVEDKHQQQQQQYQRPRRHRSHPQDKEDSPQHYPSQRPAYDSSNSYQRPTGSSRQYTEDDAPPPEPPSSYYNDLETDSSRQYDGPGDSRQYSRRGQQTDDRDHNSYQQPPKQSDSPYGRSQDRDSEEQQPYPNMQYKDSASDKEEPSYYPQHDYQEQDTYTYRPADEYRPDPYYGQPSRQQERTVGICLQRTSQQQFPGPEPYEATFRCCTPADNADSCSRNSTDTDLYAAHGAPKKTKARVTRYDEPHSFMNLVTSTPAATCRWAATDDAACPPFAFGGTSDCVAFRFNCTLSSAAAECGCPLKDGSLYFSTIVYARPLESLTCLRQPSDLNPRPYWATGAFLQGKLNSYATHEGGRGSSLVWKECEGSVEFSPVIPFGPTPPQEAYSDEYNEEDYWLRNGQMVVRLKGAHFAGGDGDDE